jgi:hypothetical protein
VFMKQMAARGQTVSLLLTIFLTLFLTIFLNIGVQRACTPFRSVIYSF